MEPGEAGKCPGFLLPDIPASQRAPVAPGLSQGDVLEDTPCLTLSLQDLPSWFTSQINHSCLSLASGSLVEGPDLRPSRTWSK